MTEKNKRHGCKDGKFLVSIQEALKEGELSGKELFKRVKLMSPEASSLKHPKDSFVQALHCLLEDRIIRIEKYDAELDPRGTRKAFKFDYFVYDLVKRKSMHIRSLLLKLNEGDENAYNELNELFNEKIKEIELYNKKNWENLLEKVITKQPINKELAFLIAREEFKEAANDPNSYLDDNHQSKLSEAQFGVDILLEDDINIYLTKSLRTKYKNRKLFLLEGSGNPRPPAGFETSIPHSIDKLYSFSKDGESALKDLGFKKPIHRTDRQIDDLFEDIILHLNHDKYIERFAMALSDRENSKQLLDKLICEISHEEKLIIEYSMHHF